MGAADALLCRAGAARQGRRGGQACPGGPGAGYSRLEDHRHDGPGTQTHRRPAMTRKQRRLTLIGVAGCVLAVALGLVLYAMNDTIVFFNSPADIQAKSVQPGTRIRLGGLVKEGSVQRGADQQITFEVMDAEAAIKVNYKGLLPDLFREGQ